MGTMNALSEYVYERDRHEFGLGDTLDIKSGLILASLTFLAVQSGNLIGPRMPTVEAVAQAISIAALIAGGALAFFVLWPRDYEREAAPDKYDEWLLEMKKFYEANPEAHQPLIEERLQAARLSAAKQRVQTNGDINKTKSAFMFRAFYCVIVSFAANVATLAMRLF